MLLVTVLVPNDGYKHLEAEFQFLRYTVGSRKSDITFSNSLLMPRHATLWQADVV